MNRLARLGLPALLVACAAATGCRSSSSSHSDTAYRSWQSSNPYSGYYMPSSAASAPTLGMSDEQVDKALERQRVKSSKRHEQALDVVAGAQNASVADVASSVAACYALGDRDAADPLTDGKKGVYAWDDCAKVATIECRYRSRGATLGGAMEVTVHRNAGVEGAFAIAFPPGTYGVADEKWTRPDEERRYGSWPSQQDLGFLRAPVLHLDADVSEDSILVPIACASFRSGPPANDQRYELHRFEPGSKIDRLMIALCARERTSESEVQLAVWLARNDISWDEFVSKGGDRGGLLTFGTASRILPRHGKGAAKLLIEAGVNPEYSTFFADHKTLEEGPAVPPVTPAKPAETEPAKPADATP